MDNIENKIKFWQELWEDLIQNFLKKSYGLTLYSPHILIEDIIVEIEENQFKNKENKKYFYLKLNEYLKNDEVIKTQLKSEFTLLRKSFDSKRINYILALCKKINQSFKKGIYFRETLILTEKIILNNSELNIDFVNKINYHSQSLIIEFIRKSFDLDDIKKFINNIFDNYKFYQKTLITKFPHNLDYKKYKGTNGKINYNEAEREIKYIIDNLTLSDRIKSLSSYYDKEIKKAKYIFYIKGIKGEIEKTIFGVTFYNIKNKRFVEDYKGFDQEDLQQNYGKDKYIQAVVEIDYLLPKSSLKLAKSKVENALDILSCYFNFKTEVSLIDTNFIILDNENKVIHSSSSRGKDDEFMNYYDALNFTELDSYINDLKDYSFLWKEEDNSETLSKIKNAMHWYRKAEQSNKDADKMLNYWIAIENLFNTKKDIKEDILNDSNKSKFSLIQEIIADKQVFKFVYEYGWELFYYFRNKVHPHIKNRLDIPENLIKQGQLKPNVGTKVYLEDFIKILPQLKQYETNLFILEKIDSVINFYSDSSFTKKRIINHIEQVKNDVLMIYRFRNLIVHNAHFDNTLLPYFVWKTRSYCGRILREFVSKYKDGILLSEIIFNIHIEKEKFILDLEKGDVNLFTKTN